MASTDFSKNPFVQSFGGLKSTKTRQRSATEPVKSSSNTYKEFGKCVECKQNAEGQFGDDSHFYCMQCWNDYDDDTKSNEKTIIKKKTTSKRQSGNHIKSLTAMLLNQNLNIKHVQKPTILKKTADFKSGDKDAKPYKTVFQVLADLDDLDEKIELIPETDSAQLIKISDANSAKESAEKYAKSMAISKKIHLMTPTDVLQHSLFDDRYKCRITPLSPDPILDLSVAQDFDTWNVTLQNEFICDVASYLNIEPHQLAPICASNGSIEFFLQLCDVINDKFPEIKKKISSLKSIANKFTNKWKLKKSEFKSFFSQKLTRSVSSSSKKETDSCLELSAMNEKSGDDKLSLAETWLLNQAQLLRQQITESLQDCSSEYQISAICALDNEQCLKDFIQFEDWKKSKLLFHGTRVDNLSSIFEGGFNDAFISNNTGNYGWYGKGHYFTSYPSYSMAYIANNYVDKQYTLIVAYVNLGKTKNIYDQSYLGKDIKEPYQSHYAKVRNCYAIAQHEWDNAEGDIFDEYVVSTGKRVLPRFYVTFTVKDKVLIWRDKNVNNAFNSGILNVLRKSHVVYAATTTKDALKVIKKKKDKNKVFVITNGADESELFIQKIRNELNVPHPIFIFSATRAQYAHVYSKYPDVDYQSSIKDFVKAHLL